MQRVKLLVKLDGQLAKPLNLLKVPGYTLNFVIGKLDTKEVGSKQADDRLQEVNTFRTTLAMDEQRLLPEQ